LQNVLFQFENLNVFLSAVICGQNVCNAPKLPDESSLIGKVRRMHRHQFGVARTRGSRLLVNFYQYFCGWGIALLPASQFGMAVA
jgi:hypothetical protein